MKVANTKNTKIKIDQKQVNWSQAGGKCSLVAENTVKSLL